MKVCFDLTPNKQPKGSYQKIAKLPLPTNSPTMQLATLQQVIKARQQSAKHYPISVFSKLPNNLIMGIIKLELDRQKAWWVRCGGPPRGVKLEGVWYNRRYKTLVRNFDKWIDVPSYKFWGGPPRTKPAAYKYITNKQLIAQAYKRNPTLANAPPLGRTLPQGCWR